MLDANLFASAVKLLPRRTASFDVVDAILRDDDTSLLSDMLLDGEYARNLARFPSPERASLHSRLLDRAQIVDVGEHAIVQVGPLLPPTAYADTLHAAACFQEGAILISNDHDFDALAESGLVEVWSVARAVREFLK